MDELAMAAYGSQLQRGDGEDPEEFVPVAEITSDIPTSIKRPAIDVTSHGSEGWRRKIGGGLRNLEPITFTCNLIRDEVEDDFREDLASGLAHNYRVVDPDGIGVEFAALVTSFDVAHPLEGALQATITLDPSGTVTDIDEGS